MVEKPTSGDEEQRRAQTRAARQQSGLPPETDNGGSQDAEGQSARDGGASDSAGSGDAGANPAPEEDR